MIRSLLLVVSLAFAAFLGTANAAECISQAPPTVYEATEMSPQNADYDKVNNMFVAHPGWYNDKLVHYYKFRIFAPATYDGLISDTSTAANIPVGKVFLVTTTGDFDGVVGMPIIKYHTADGNLYSDIMALHFVTVDANYTEDAFKGVKDIDTSGAEVSSADILINMPVVPTGSSLQHPRTKGTTKAPIAALKVWYNCVMVETFVFEATAAAAASYFSYTRTYNIDDATATARNAAEIGFDITVAPAMGNAATKKLSAIPIWHLNQFTRGVTAGTNGGGPSPDGMRNVVALDRPDAGYSPVWQIKWAVKLPIDFSANEASNSLNFTEDNGFKFIATPMFVNCPNIGAVDTTTENPDIAESFKTKIDVSQEKNVILGSDGTLIFNNDMPITFFAADGTELGSVQTNAMGAYEFELESSSVPEGTEMIKVMFKEALIDTIEVEMGSSSAGTTSLGISAMMAIGGLALAFW